MGRVVLEQQGSRAEGLQQFAGASLCIQRKKAGQRTYSNVLEPVSAFVFQEAPAPGGWGEALGGGCRWDKPTEVRELTLRMC